VHRGSTSPWRGGEGKKEKNPHPFQNNLTILGKKIYSKGGKEEIMTLEREGDFSSG